MKIVSLQRVGNSSEEYALGFSMRRENYRDHSWSISEFCYLPKFYKAVTANKHEFFFPADKYIAEYAPDEDSETNEN